MYFSNQKKHAAILLTLVIVLTSFLTGLIVGANTQDASEKVTLQGKEEGKPEDVSFEPFWRAWVALEEKFVPSATSSEQTSDQEKVWGAIQGLAASLGDPYTVFLPPADSEIFESDISGNFEGVGMEIGMRNNILTVISPLKGTPAERAGIRAGDQILAIDSTSTASMGVDEAVKRIRGEKGTPIILTVLHPEEEAPEEITVIRDQIDIPTIVSELRDDGVFVIELYNFSAVSSNLFRGALRDFATSGSDKLILDLRGNPGGFLEAAVDMASWFLPAGKTVVTEDFAGKRDSVVYRSKGYNIFNENLKMAILVNQGSASASEILAGALREHNVATIVGAQTFGKGSVQELIKITPQTSLKVTIARWLTPLGNSISENGIIPDVEVEITEEDILAGRDPQLEKAAEVLKLQ